MFQGAGVKQADLTATHLTTRELETLTWDLCEQPEQRPSNHNILDDITIEV